MSVQVFDYQLLFSFLADPDPALFFFNFQLVKPICARLEPPAFFVGWDFFSSVPKTHLMSKEGNQRRVVLTKPVSLEAESDGVYRPPNLLKCVLSLFEDVRPGSDLTNFRLSPLFNIPKSQLQYYGESVYSTASDLLSKCNSAENPLERLINVVAWNISTTRPVTFGVAPYNPVLGETHHVSKGNLNVLLEQVSHHPPLSALHATDDKENIEMIWWMHPAPKFNGTSVEARMHGRRQMKLLNHGETYEMNSPSFLIKFLPSPGYDWIGNVYIRCPQTDLEAELCYKSNSFLGLRGKPRTIKGKIFHSSSFKVLYEVEGHWDRCTTVKDTRNGKVRVIYDAKEAICGLQAPIVKDAESVWPTESAVIWSELSQAIMSKDWDKAKEVKKAVEERQRELLKERESKGQIWIPKHFKVIHNEEGVWDCSPIQKWVPAAPIISL